MEIVAIEYFIVLPFSCISIISCVFIVTICIASEYIRKNKEYSLIFVLSIIEIISYLNIVLPAVITRSDTLCIIQSYIRIATSLVNIIWIAYISFETFSVVIKQNSPLKYGIYTPLFVINSLSFALSAIPLVLGLYGGRSGAWCWIKIENAPNYEEFGFAIGLTYGMYWICIIFNSIISVIVSRKLKRLSSGNLDKVVKKIKNYPIILCIVYLPMSISRLLNCFYIRKVEFDIFASVIRNLEGFFNFLIFINESDVKCLLKENLKKKKSLVSSNLFDLDS